jgi:hypothetical protein
VAAGVKSGQHDDIAALCIQLAIGPVGELRAGKNDSRLQLEVTEVED